MFNRKFIYVPIIVLALSASNLSLATDNEIVFAAIKAKQSLDTPVEIGSLKLSCELSMKNPAPEIINELKKTCPHFFEDEHISKSWNGAMVSLIDNLPESETRKTFFSNNIPDMDFICPNFKNFDIASKKKFWAWTFAAIAYDESGCKGSPHQSDAAVKKQGVGLLQLNKKIEDRLIRVESCKRSDMLNPINNLSCGVEMLHQQLLGQASSYFSQTKNTGELFWSGSYWNKLRYKNRNDDSDQDLLLSAFKEPVKKKKSGIKELIMRFDGCR
jgi:hypothetical protein